MRIKSAEPEINNQDLERELQDIQTHFNQAISYLEASTNSSSTLQVRRESGTKHKVRIACKTGSNFTTYSNVLIVFSEDSTLPIFSVNTPNTSKPNSNSIAAKYATNPSSFKYYDRFGIFEIYAEV